MNWAETCARASRASVTAAHPRAAAASAAVAAAAAALPEVAAALHLAAAAVVLSRGVPLLAAAVAARAGTALLRDGVLRRRTSALAPPLAVASATPGRRESVHVGRTVVSRMRARLGAGVAGGVEGRWVVLTRIGWKRGARCARKWQARRIREFMRLQTMMITQPRCIVLIAMRVPCPNICCRPHDL